jgi:hypothetical protein
MGCCDVNCAGIGKSIFRFYLLYRLCELHVSKSEAFTVVLQSSPDDTGLQRSSGSSVLLRYAADGSLTSEHSPSATLPTAWKVLLTVPNDVAYYITDGMPPDVSFMDPKKVHIIEVSSPLEKRWKLFTSGLAAGVVDVRYMPLVPLAEMQHMREHVGLIDAAEVRSRYEQLGGSVRGVLVRARVPAESIIDTALTHATSLGAVLASSTTSGELEGSGIAHIPSTLVHFRVSEEAEAVGPLADAEGTIQPSPRVVASFGRYEAIFASNFIRRQILLKFHSRFVALLGEMVRTADLPYTSVLQGNLYEEFVHERMQAAVPNPCELRNLESGVVAAASVSSSSATVDLSGFPCTEFDDAPELAGIALEDGRYYKPISRSFGAVDFVFGRDTVGNMTLNLRHGISITALLRVVRAMGFTPVQNQAVPPVLRFFWLLPTRSLFLRMSKQPLSYAGHVIPTAATASASSGTAGAAQQKQQELEQLVRLQQFAVYLPPSDPTQAAARVGAEGESQQSSVARESSGVMELEGGQGDAGSSIAARGLRKRKAEPSGEEAGGTAAGGTSKRGGGRGGGGGGGSSGSSGSNRSASSTAAAAAAAASSTR